jgi:stearoyl-CoA desaturase (delta-9 desaturase)
MWGNIPAFVLMHLGCLAAFWQGASRSAVMVCLATYTVRAFGIGAGFHRYFSHRSFKTSRGFQYVLAVLGTMAVQKGVLWWAAHHRRHHQYADQEGDPHSPARGGFWWSHLGWFLAPDYEATDWSRIRDFACYPELVWLNEHALVPPLALAGGLYLAGGLEWLLWGFVVSTTLLWHMTYAVNSLAHRWGRRRYETPDESRNNLWLALLYLGEGWHNNHHRHMSSARAGLRWWEIDPIYWVLVSFSYLGVTWDLRRPPVLAHRLGA